MRRLLLRSHPPRPPHVPRLDPKGGALTSLRTPARAFRLRPGPALSSAGPVALAPVPQEYRNKLRYVPAQKQWHVWNDKHWKPDTLQKPMDFAKQIGASLMDRAKREGGDDLLKHARRSQYVGGLRAMGDLAASDPNIVVTPAMLTPTPGHCLRSGGGDNSSTISTPIAYRPTPCRGPVFRPPRAPMPGSSMRGQASAERAAAARGAGADTITRGLGDASVDSH